ncbi:hypothetical protein L6452_22692 [Arctium lappa]|uniref:Uncharacterized protein n=1 Tax=Arctium lappa TaxID=4217 RepID=A0ACB9B1S1_ARCLA|nr:hypothetical protein L6452_22692 [Arctium lappa]
MPISLTLPPTSSPISTLIHIGSLLQEDYGLLGFADLEQLENPDLHVDSVRMMNLFNKIREVIVALDCPNNFTLKDLINPEADRTELFLSAILNFCLHMDTRMNLLRPVMEDLTVSNDKSWRLEYYRVHLEKKKDAAKEMDEKISSAEFALVQSAQENASVPKLFNLQINYRALEEKKAVQVEAKNAERAAMQSFHEKTAILEVYTKVDLEVKFSSLNGRLQYDNFIFVEGKLFYFHPLLRVLAQPLIRENGISNS